MAVGVRGLGSRRSARAMRVKTVLRCVKRTFAARGTLDSPRRRSPQRSSGLLRCRQPGAAARCHGRCASGGFRHEFRHRYANLSGVPSAGVLRMGRDCQLEATYRCGCRNPAVMASPRPTRYARRSQAFSPYPRSDPGIRDGGPRHHMPAPGALLFVSHTQQDFSDRRRS